MKIADEVNAMNTTWKAGHNVRFDNQTKESVRSLFMQPELMATKTNTLSKVVFTQEQLSATTPESFDARSYWSNCESLQETRDQSSCGSCWAFGAAEVMSDRVCIGSNGRDQRRVSAEDILECCTDCGNGCQGGMPYLAFLYWQSTGVSTGDLYGDTKYCKPYAFAPCDHHTTSSVYGPCPSTLYDTPTCKKTCNNGDDYESSKIFASTAYMVTGEQDMMKELSTKGPIEVAFSVYEDFLAYKSGVYQHITGEAHGGHAVKAVGYGTEDGTPYWLIVNSWNETWGDMGTFKILRGSDECGIETQGVAGDARL